MNGNDIRAILALSRADRVVLANEIDALDAWRDAKCAAIRIKAPTSDAGEYGCNVGYDGDGEHDGNHDERCPVAVARIAFFAASDRRRAL
jgi:hypothetical protein